MVIWPSEKRPAGEIVRTRRCLIENIRHQEPVKQQCSVFFWTMSTKRLSATFQNKKESPAGLGGYFFKVVGLQMQVTS